ncbi:MAG: MFS transporter [Acidobacteria bacterium]|nr:MFS transporter [Acidobacteriota bacterium]
MTSTDQDRQTPAPPAPSRRYSNYVLGVLVLVYVFNFIDRQIISILAEDIRADLGIGDAQLGFLYGTAFAVFYAIFGIPLGRMADMWTRKSLISIGLAAWSLMTALSGTARGFASLAAYRIGVGIGESSASPAAFSMLGDYFPPRLRATVTAIYSSGVYIGSGVGIAIGGLIVDRWNAAYSDGGAPFGLVGWQVAFFAVGVPGLLMAVWVWTLREPVRGLQEGIVTANHPAPFRELGKETAAVLPPLTLLSLNRVGGGRAVGRNLLIALGCAAVVFLLIQALGSPVQWIALGIGAYAFFSWVQGLRIRDRPAFELIYGTRSMVHGMIGFGWMGFVAYGAGFWGPTFFRRVHEVSATEAGVVLGLTMAAAGWIGVAGGGVVSDRMKQKNPRARTLCGLLAALASIPCGVAFLLVENTLVAYFVNFAFAAVSASWIGSAIAMSSDLVLPRMRGTSAAFYILAVTFVGLALGPFLMGWLSGFFEAGGADPGRALQLGILVGLAGYAVAAVFFWLAGRSVEADESSRVERAQAAGEVVEAA